MSDYRFSLVPADKNSEAVAQISKDSKENKGKLIYLNKDARDVEEKANDKLTLFYEYARNKRIKQSDYDDMVNAIELNEVPENKKTKDIYNDFKTHLRRSSEVLFKNATLEVVPFVGDNELRETILVCGNAGSGKSYWVGQYLEKWQKLFPKSPIYLLSNKPLADEKAYSKLKKIQQIPLTKARLDEIIGENEDIVDADADGYSPHQYFISNTGESMVVFDDYESGGSIEKQVRIIMNSVLTVGRSKRIYCIIVSHSINAGQKTKLIYSEVDAFVYYPSGLSPSNLKYNLLNYTKLDQRQISKIIDSNSRWVFIHKNKPTYIIEETRLWLF
jgi:hypothetical protein